MSKILIVAPSWVGDAVMAEPLLRRLLERQPGSLIDVLAPAWVAPVLQYMPQVRHVIENPFPHGTLDLGRRWTLAQKLRPEGYDQAIVLPNSLKSALIPFFAGIPRRTGYRGEMRYGLLDDLRQLDKNALPRMVERFAALAEENGEPLHRPAENPHLTAEKFRIEATFARLHLAPSRPVAAFSVGAEYGEAKRWPVAHFAKLAQMLANAGHEIWLLGSPKKLKSEKPSGNKAIAWRKICAAKPPSMRPLTSSQPLILLSSTIPV